MRFSLLLIIFGGLCALDALAVLLAMGKIESFGFPSITAALAIHVVVTVVAFVVVTSLRRKGSASLAILAAAICLMTPVVGCLISLWIIRPLRVSNKDDDPFSGMRFGNPLTETVKHLHPEPTIFDKPLAVAFREENKSLQRLAVPRIRQLSDRRAVAILRALNSLSDAQTHLFAQAAVASGFERREKQLETLRLAAKEDFGDLESLAKHERLATALVHQAELNPATANSALAEATRSYKKALAIDPEDQACLSGMARCLIRLGKLDEAQQVCEKIASIKTAGQFTAHLAPSYFAARGDWKRTAVTSAGIKLRPSARQFWAGDLPSSAK